MKEKNGFETCLQDNKIYFETIMTISLTLMGIAVSCILLSIDKKVADIQKEQLELQHLLNMPVFNVSIIRHREEYIFDGIIYAPYMEYEIVNNGGNI